MSRSSAFTELLHSKLVADRLTQRQDAVRSSKLHSFLARHKDATQWAIAVAALVDACDSGLTPQDRDIAAAITSCGKAGKLRASAALYTTLYKRLKKPRPLTSHVVFMRACADCKSFKVAANTLQKLRERDERLFAKDASHSPVLNDELVTAYLQAAVAVELERLESTPESADQKNSATPEMKEERGKEREKQSASVPCVWDTALKQLVSLRQHPQLRKHVPLSPVLLEQIALLAEIGGQWRFSLDLIRSCGQQSVLIPPEVYDTGIRTCFKSKQHSDVVSLITQCIASRSPPDERSVRMALISAEEVQAQQRRSSDVSTSASWALSLVLFQSLENNGLPLFQQTYEAPLRTCAMAGKWEAALTVLSTMKRDGRPVEPHVYRQVLCAKIEHCNTFKEAERFAELPVMKQGGNMVVALAMLRCCINLQDWKNFNRVSNRMKRQEIPETYESIQVLLEGAYHQQQWHSVLMRFARFENITNYERTRVVSDRLVQLYEEDFTLPDRIVEMVLEAYEKLGNHSDPMVEVAYRAAMRRKSDGREQISSEAPTHTPTEPWMYSQEERNKQDPPMYH